MRKRGKKLEVDEDFHKLFKMRACARGMSIREFSKHLLSKQNGPVSEEKGSGWSFRI